MVFKFKFVLICLFFIGNYLGPRDFLEEFSPLCCVVLFVIKSYYIELQSYLCF